MRTETLPSYTRAVVHLLILDYGVPGDMLDDLIPDITEHYHQGYSVEACAFGIQDELEHALEYGN